MTRPKLMKADLEERKRLARRTAPGPDVPPCSVCGCHLAPYGFRDLHACQSIECRSICEARAYPTNDTGRAA